MYEKLLNIIETLYGLKIAHIKVLKHAVDRSITKVFTQTNRTYVLKGMQIRKEKADFIIQTEILLNKRGIPLALPISYGEHQYFFQEDGLLFILYEWVEGSTFSFRDTSDLKKLVQLAAYLHRSSLGLCYRPGTYLEANVHWSKKYTQYLIVLKQWKEANSSAVNAKVRMILGSIPFFYDLGLKASRLLESSDYDAYRALPFEKRFLVHGDFHTGNILCDSQKIFLIDFENVHYNLPSKDLMRIWKRYIKHHPFDQFVFLEMMNTYLKEYPSFLSLQHVAMIDFLFPYHIEQMIRRKQYEQMRESELKHFIEQEQATSQFVWDHYFER